VGVVRVSLVALREALLPAPRQQLAALRALLPRLAGALLNAFLAQVRALPAGGAGCWANARTPGNGAAVFPRRAQLLLPALRTDTLLWRAH
jgi:hypothetical protein